jgi:hypothetical protein
MKPCIGSEVVLDGEEDFNRVFLENHAEMITYAPGIARDIKSHDGGGSGCGGDQGGQNPEERCFSGTISAENAKNFAAVDFKRKIIQSADRALAFVAVDFHQICANNGIFGGFHSSEGMTVVTESQALQTGMETDGEQRCASFENILGVAQQRPPDPRILL